ncbi:MAG: anthranilate phosphoribosyltransferase [Planctomycetota bacterium]
MHEVLAELMEGGELTEERSAEVFGGVMDGGAEPLQVASLLSLLASRGPTVGEVVGLARVMRERVRRVAVPSGLTVIDTCGMGGTGSRLFNISTTTAIVAAAAGRSRGLCVCKHGNRSVTSVSGSSQAIELLGVNVEADDATLTKCLDEVGLCFCHAPMFHSAMKHAAPIRKALGFRTIFNVVGPLTNPAGAKRQLIGVPTVAMTELVAEAVRRLGDERSMIVHCRLPDGRPLGELTTFGTNTYRELDHGMVSGGTLEAESLGLPLGIPSAAEVESPEASAELIGRLLGGEHGPARDVVLLNTAAALRVGGAIDDLREGIELAAEAIDSGAAKETLSRLGAMTKGGG